MRTGGARNFYSKREINSLVDMEGLRVRAQGQMMIDMCEALGAVPSSTLNEFQRAMQPLYDKYASQYRSMLNEIQSMN